jgi:hypothetical protein
MRELLLPEEAPGGSYIFFLSQGKKAVKETFGRGKNTNLEYSFVPEHCFCCEMERVDVKVNCCQKLF